METWKSFIAQPVYNRFCLPEPVAYEVESASTTDILYSACCYGMSRFRSMAVLSSSGTFASDGLDRVWQVPSLAKSFSGVTIFDLGQYHSEFM